jgi:hypothetical protein
VERSGIVWKSVNGINEKKWKEKRKKNALSVRSCKDTATVVVAANAGCS